jgi:hypothetical protein
MPRCPSKHPRTIEGVPACSACGRRPARPHHVVGWWRLCVQCHRVDVRRHAKHRGLQRCTICGTPHLHATCSPRCSRLAKRQHARRQKGVVVAALGGCCTCPGTDGCWHVGACGVVLLDALTVDHQHGDGGRIRRQRRDGSMGRSRTMNWSLYRRALALPEHGMRLLCFNCHHVVDIARRRVHLVEPA